MHVTVDRIFSPNLSLCTFICKPIYMNVYTYEGVSRHSRVAGETYCHVHVVKPMSLDRCHNTYHHTYILDKYELVLSPARIEAPKIACACRQPFPRPPPWVRDSNTLHSPVSNLSGHISSQISAGENIVVKYTYMGVVSQMTTQARTKNLQREFQRLESIGPLHGDKFFVLVLWRDAVTASPDHKPS